MTTRPVALSEYPRRLKAVLGEKEQVYKVLRPDGTVMFFQGLIIVPVYLGVVIVGIVSLVSLGIARGRIADWWTDIAATTLGSVLWIVAGVLVAMLLLWVPYYYLAGFRRTLFVVTSERVLSMGGLTGRRFRFLPHERATAVSVVRGFIDDLLNRGTGSVVVSGAGRARVDLGPLRNPHVVKEYVDAVQGRGSLHSLQDALAGDTPGPAAKRAA